MRRQAAVIGNPIGHSRSPVIFGFIARALGLGDFSYQARAVLPGELDEFVQEVRRSPSYVGFNVTLPHKTAMLSRVDELSADARTIGAINAVVRRGPVLVGLNTDVLGILGTLAEQGCVVEGGDCVLWGAGGAARAVGYALGTLGARSVTLTGARAESVAAVAAQLGPAFPGTAFRALEPGASLPAISLCVNTTPIGMKAVPRARDGRPPEEVFAPLGRVALRPDALAFDLIYAPAQTPFLSLGRARGMRVVGGLPMLIDQALATWDAWFAPLAVEERARLRAGLHAHLVPLLGWPADERPVFLTGMMGVGKSAVGAALAARLGWGFVDTDQRIEARRGRPIRELFAAEGEGAFRALEKQVVAEAALTPRTVISLGGGALVDPETLSLVLGAGRLVHLSARVDTLLARLTPRLEDRPLLAGLPPAARRAELERLLASRQAAYRQAQVELATDDGTPGEIAERVLARLEEQAR